MKLRIEDIIKRMEKVKEDENTGATFEYYIEMLHKDINILLADRTEKIDHIAKLERVIIEDRIKRLL